MTPTNCMKPIEHMEINKYMYIYIVPRARCSTDPQGVPAFAVAPEFRQPFFALFSGCPFSKFFSILIQLWLPFPLRFTSLFFKFCKLVSDPVFARTFYGFVWISGAQTPQQSCFYNHKTMIPTKTPNRIFSKHSLIICTMSASFGEPLAHKTHILIALIC